MSSSQFQHDDELDEMIDPLPPSWWTDALANAKPCADHSGCEIVKAQATRYSDSLYWLWHCTFCGHEWGQFVEG